MSEREKVKKFIPAEPDESAKKVILEVKEKLDHNYNWYMIESCIIICANLILASLFAICGNRIIILLLIYGLFLRKRVSIQCNKNVKKYKEKIRQIEKRYSVDILSGNWYLSVFSFRYQDTYFIHCANCNIREGKKKQRGTFSCEREGHQTIQGKWKEKVNQAIPFGCWVVLKEKEKKENPCDCSSLLLSDKQDD